MRTRRKGFTLVELAIVIAILGILAVVAIPKYQGMVDEARSAAAKSQLGTVRSALAISYAKNKGVFPATLDGTIFADGAVPGVDTGSGPVIIVVAGAWSGGAWTPALTTAGGWEYDHLLGKVVINSTAIDPVAGGAAWSTY